MAECSVCGYDPDDTAWNVVRILKIDSVWPSHNELSANVKGRGGYKYRKWRTHFEKLIPKAGAPAETHRRVWFKRRWGYRKRAFDRINLAGGGKPLLDVLVRHGWLVDDTPKWLVDYYEQEKNDDKIDVIEIIIEERLSDE